jgi:hypothetical protein
LSNWMQRWTRTWKTRSMLGCEYILKRSVLVEERICEWCIGLYTYSVCFITQLVGDDPFPDALYSTPSALVNSKIWEIKTKQNNATPYGSVWNQAVHVEERLPEDCLPLSPCATHTYLTRTTWRRPAMHRTSSDLSGVNGTRAQSDRPLDRIDYPLLEWIRVLFGSRCARSLRTECAKSLLILTLNVLRETAKSPLFLVTSDAASKLSIIQKYCAVRSFCWPHSRS